MKRLLALLLALGLLGSSFALAAGAPFGDVKQGDWYYDAVQTVYSKGLMNGTDDGVFAPNGITTRAAVVTILHRMAGSPNLGASSFPDVAPNSWYSRAVAWGASKGIVLGYDDGTFRPDEAVTREQMAMILRRYASYEGYSDEVSMDLSYYTDSSSVSPSAQMAVAWAVQSGIITGLTDRQLAPTGRTTRAQLATILTRYLSYMELHN